MDFNPDKMRTRFHRLSAQAEAMRAKAGPLRQKRDKLVQKQMAELAKADSAVAAAEKGLFDIDQERALIARALGHRVGEA